MASCKLPAIKVQAVSACFCVPDSVPAGYILRLVTYRCCMQISRSWKCSCIAKLQLDSKRFITYMQASSKERKESLHSYALWLRSTFWSSNCTYECKLKVVLKATPECITALNGFCTESMIAFQRTLIYDAYCRSFQIWEMLLINMQNILGLSKYGLSQATAIFSNCAIFKY